MKIKKVSFIVAVVIIVVFVASIAVALFYSQEKSNAADNPVINVTKPKKTTTTTVPQLSLPQPQDSPANEYEDVPVVEIGSIQIPKISLNTTLYEGVWLTVLNHGPGHWPGTAEAGGYGNMVIAGHRVTHSRPFRNIDQLVEGDEIKVTSSTGTYTYKVTGHEIVYPKDIWIVDQTPGYRLTLFACHPPGSAAQRYVVYADLVNPPTKIES